MPKTPPPVRPHVDDHLSLGDALIDFIEVDPPFRLWRMKLKRRWARRFFVRAGIDPDLTIHEVRRAIEVDQSNNARSEFTVTIDGRDVTVPMSDEKCRELMELYAPTRRVERDDPDEPLTGKPSHGWRWRGPEPEEPLTGKESYGA